MFIHICTVTFGEKLIFAIVARSTVFESTLELFKYTGGIVSESFSLLHKSQKKVPNHYPDHLLFKWLLRTQDSALVPFFGDFS